MTAPTPDAVARARENVVMCYHPANFSEEEFLDRLAALIAVVRAECAAKAAKVACRFGDQGFDWDAPAGDPDHGTAEEKQEILNRMLGALEAQP